MNQSISQPTTNDIRVMSLLIQELQPRIGAANVISGRQMIKQIKYKFPELKLSGLKVRDMIHIIRVCAIIPNLVATRNGYYVAETEEEHELYMQSIIGRIEKIEDVKIAVQKQLKYLK